MNSPLKWLSTLGMGAILLFLHSCAPAPGPITQQPVAYSEPQMSPQRTLYEWYDDGGLGEVSIRISLSNQMAVFSRGGREIGWSYVTTGRPGQRTPTGSFSISEKTVEKISNRWGRIVDEFGNTVEESARSDQPRGPGERWVAAPMPYWMRLTSWGIGIHAGPIPRPGTPVSAGCIRLPSELAPQVFQAVKIGTRVTITQ